MDAPELLAKHLEGLMLGSDSFVVRGGKIVMQSSAIAATPKPKP